MNRDREIDLRELLYYALKRWRAIIVISVAAALLFGIFSIFTIEERADDAEEKMEIETVISELDTLKQRLESQKEYNEKSIVMKINPVCKHRATFEIYIDARHEDGETGSSYDTNAARRISAAYSSYLTSNAFYSYVLKNTKTNNDIKDEDRYLREVLWHNVDSASAAITVNISGDTKERVADTLDAVKKAINEEYLTIKDEVGDHDIYILMESIHTLVDNSINDTQKAYKNMVSTYEKSIEEKENQLAALSGQNAVENISDTRLLAVSAVKAIAVAFVVALFAIVCYMALGIFSHKMWNRGNWSSCGIPVLGIVYAKKEHRAGAKIDAWIEKITGCAVSECSPEKSGALAAANAAASLKENKAECAAIISAENKELCGVVVAGMNDYLPNTFKFAGDILTEPEAVSALDEFKEVIILTDGEKITIDNVNLISERLSVWGKKLIGVILIK